MSIELLVQTRCLQLEVSGVEREECNASMMVGDDIYDVDGEVIPDPIARLSCASE